LTERLKSKIIDLDYTFKIMGIERRKKDKETELLNTKESFMIEYIEKNGKVAIDELRKKIITASKEKLIDTGIGVY